MEFASLLVHPLLLAAVALIAVFFAAAWLLRAFHTADDEARAGIKLLCATRWSEFSYLISELLKDRGMEPGNADRSPGQDGFDLLFKRGKSRYLVQCTNAAAQRVTASTVGQLHALVQSQEAEGAIIASCGPVEPDALRLAQDRRIEVIADTDLWAQVKPWVAHDQRTDAEDSAAAIQRRRIVVSASIALVAALITFFAVSAIRAPDDTAAMTASPTPVVAPAANRPAATRKVPALPDTALTEEQLTSRRAGAVLEVRGLSRVSSAVWSTRSTLQVTLHGDIGDDKLPTLVNDICRSLLQYEELRFTRLQMETPSADEDQPPRVRWSQCR